METGLITGASATSAGAEDKGIAKALSNALGTTEKRLKIATQPQSAISVTPGIAATTEKPAEPVKLPNVTQIPSGMPREELLAKFGNPSQKMTIPDGGHLIERFRYDLDKESVKVILQDGKVKEAFALPAAPLVQPR